MTLTVTLIDYTGIGTGDPYYAARLLAFTKATRLQMSPDTFKTFLDMMPQQIEEEMAYMAGTIPSSWEFVDATFTLQGITRATAQQITRTRFTPMDGDIFGAYAMQSQRVNDLADVVIAEPPQLDKVQKIHWDDTASDIRQGYRDLIEIGLPLEDARGLLPMNSECNLVVKYNLRLLAELFRKRQSLRVQGQFVDVVTAMRKRIETVWPWSTPFFIPHHAMAIAIIERLAATLPTEQKRELAKAADLLKVS